MLRCIAKDAEELRKVLFGQPGDRKVEADPDIGIFAKTVDELRALTTWPPGLVVILPRENYPESTVSIIKSG